MDPESFFISAPTEGSVHFLTTEFAVQPSRNLCSRVFDRVYGWAFRVFPIFTDVSDAMIVPLGLHFTEVGAHL